MFEGNKVNETINEIWKDIKGYEGLYQVSNLGRVKSLEKIDFSGHKRKCKILKLALNRYGYAYLTLSKNGNKKAYTVHRLVAESFIPNPNKLPFVNHKDENKSNNRVKNLEWCTHEYNINYGTCRERMSKKVKCITTNEIFISITEASKKYNLCDGDISRCCQGKRSYCGKLKTDEKLVWKYL